MGEPTVKAPSARVAPTFVGESPRAGVHRTQRGSNVPSIEELSDDLWITASTPIMGQLMATFDFAGVRPPPRPRLLRIPFDPSRDAEFITLGRERRGADASDRDAIDAFIRRVRRRSAQTRRSPLLEEPVRRLVIAERHVIGATIPFDDGFAVPILSFESRASRVPPVSLPRSRASDPLERPASDLVEGLTDAVLAVLDSHVSTRAGMHNRYLGVLPAENALWLAGHQVCCSVHSLRGARGPHPDVPVFQCLCALAAARYESRAVQVTIVFRPDSPIATTRRARVDGTASLWFRPGKLLTDTRSCRKLLEIAADGGLAVSNGYAVVGIDVGGHVGPREISAVITGFERWELRFGSKVIMEVERGRPHLPRPTLDPGLLSRFIALHFPARHAAVLAEQVCAARRTPRGAMVVIDAEARIEAARLGTSAQAIRPTRLDAVTVTMAARIDGAIMLDATGMCFAIGTILDGIADESGGSSGRGARYNSADRYVRARRGSALAFVLSEDGTCDVFVWNRTRERVEARSVPDQLFAPWSEGADE